MVLNRRDLLYVNTQQDEVEEVGKLKSKDNSACNLNRTNESLKICMTVLLLLLQLACFEDSVKTEL